MGTPQALEGKSVFIIGGGSGIGLETAIQAQRIGARVVLGGIDRQQLEQAAESVPGATTIHLDISNRQSVEAAFASLTSLDHLVITAGRRINGKIQDNDPDYLLQAVQERVWGVVYAVRAALPLLAKDGSIVLTSGVLARRPISPGNAVFASSVGAIEALVRGLALELSPIRVNAVAPGVTDSPLFRALPPSERAEFLERAASRTLVKRAGQVQDMAQAFVFVMCNTFMNGEILRVDGGAQIVWVAA